MPLIPDRITRPLHATAIIAAFAFQAACDDPTGLQANDPTQTSVVSLYALTGTPIGFPSALSLPANQAVTIDGNLLFDVAFDIDAQQRAVFFPMSLVAWERIAVHQVGMIKATESYDAVTRAPASGYNYEDPLIVSVGDVIVVESNDTRICSFPFPPRLYAKVVVDAIDLSSRSIRLRMTQNPNCGFRSFLAGIPED
jgi:hypothetical protein